MVHPTKKDDVTCLLTCHSPSDDDNDSSLWRNALNHLGCRLFPFHLFLLRNPHDEQSLSLLSTPPGASHTELNDFFTQLTPQCQASCRWQKRNTLEGQPLTKHLEMLGFLRLYFRISLGLWNSDGAFNQPMASLHWFFCWPPLDTWSQWKTRQI